MSGTELANYEAARRFLAEACLRLIRKYFKNVLSKLTPGRISPII
jgi:hypothetical protein